MLIRYYGHVGVESGYGEAAAETCMAILAAGLDLEISTDGKTLESRFLPLAGCIRQEAELDSPDVVIVHTLPLDCCKVLERARIRERYPAATCIAYTTWEGSSSISPDVGASLLKFDQVWVPSSVTSYRMYPRRPGQAMRGAVMIVPHAFDDEAWTEPPPAEPVGAQPFRFYYVGAWAVRKNVDGLVRAYLSTFAHTDNVELIIHSASAADSAATVAQFACGLSGPCPKIRFSNWRMSRAEILALHRECHVFVTASRGEAWNMPAFDAMLAGRHVIAPAGQGSDDFLKDTSAALYGSFAAPAYGEVRLVHSDNAPPGHAHAVYLGNQGMDVRSEWREPDLLELSTMMRDAYRRGVTSLRRRYDPAERFGRAAVGRLIKQILEGSR